MNAELKNHQIILASRPKGMPDTSNFRLNETTIPEPSSDEVLIKSLYLSVDPYMRGRMNDRPSYIPPFQLDKPLIGGVVGKVLESKSTDFQKDDIVQGMLPWSEYSVAKSKDLHKLDPTLAPISTALGVLGMPGMTAYFGFLDIGRPQPRDTVVVSGAAGAVGMIVGQIAKLIGCRVVGIAGGNEKVEYLVKDLGFHAAVNYKNKDFAEELKKACPMGVDIYFDNVGGMVTDEVFKLINKNARIIICGQISMYNLENPDVGPRNLWIVLTKTALVKGFMVYDYSNFFPEGIKQMANWIKEGKIKYHENITEGLENAPKAFLGLFKGENIGKQLVKV